MAENTKKRSRNKTSSQNNSSYLNSYTRIRMNLIDEDTPFAALEAYKSARTHLLYTCPGDKCKKIAFTSANAHEGKTLTCINLAISLAQTGKRVLIIDADLRRPMLNNVFELNESQGLSELLAGISQKDSVESVQVFACKTKYENLAVLPAGNIPPNPAELLSTPQLHNIIEVLENYFDYIFFDTPPIGVVTDTALLIPEVQGHVFVTRAGVARLEGVRRATDTMKQLGGNILGFLLNDYDPKKGLKNYYRYGYGYGYRRYGYSDSYGYYGGNDSYGSYGGYGGYDKKAKRPEPKNDQQTGENRENFSGKNAEAEDGQNP